MPYWINVPQHIKDLVPSDYTFSRPVPTYVGDGIKGVSTTCNPPDGDTTRIQVSLYMRKGEDGQYIVMNKVGCINRGAH
jgi:hypothetical protein